MRREETSAAGRADGACSPRRAARAFGWTSPSTCRPLKAARRASTGCCGGCVGVRAAGSSGDLGTPPPCSGDRGTAPRGVGGGGAAVVRRRFRKLRRMTTSRAPPGPAAASGAGPSITFTPSGRASSYSKTRPTRPLRRASECPRTSTARFSGGSTSRRPASYRPSWCVVAHVRSGRTTTKPPCGSTTTPRAFRSCGSGPTSRTNTARPGCHGDPPPAALPARDSVGDAGTTPRPRPPPGSGDGATSGDTAPAPRPLPPPGDAARSAAILLPRPPGVPGAVVGVCASAACTALRASPSARMDTGVPDRSGVCGPLPPSGDGGTDPGRRIVFISDARLCARAAPPTSPCGVPGADCRDTLGDRLRFARILPPMPGDAAARPRACGVPAPAGVPGADITPRGGGPAPAPPRRGVDGADARRSGLGGALCPTARRGVGGPWCPCAGTTEGPRARSPCPFIGSPAAPAYAAGLAGTAGGTLATLPRRSRLPPPPPSSRWSLRSPVSSESESSPFLRRALFLSFFLPNQEGIEKRVGGWKEVEGGGGG